MEKLTFDTGVREYDINGTATLRMNPTDPNLYARLVDAVDEIAEMESEYLGKAKQPDSDSGMSAGALAVRLLQDADQRAKAILNRAFGNRNDFEQIFDGVNIVAKRKAGGRVLDAFLEVIMPIIQEGVQDFIKDDEAAIEKYTAEYK